MRLARPFDVLLDPVAGWRFLGDPDPTTTGIEATGAGLGLRRDDVAGAARRSAKATLARLRFAKTAAVWHDRLLVLDLPLPGPPPADPVAGRARIGLWTWAPGMPTVEPIFGIGPAGAAPRELAAPQALAVSERDDLLIADTGNSRVQIFTLPDLALRAVLTLCAGEGATTPWRPIDVAGAPAGAVLVADTGGRIVRFDRQGRRDPRYRGELPAGSRPELIAVDREGFCYIGLERANAVLILDPYGRLATTPEPILPAYLEARLPSPGLVMDGPRVVLSAPTIEGCRAAPVISPVEVDAAGAIRLGPLALEAALDRLLGSAAADPLGSRPLGDGALAEALAQGGVPPDRPPTPDEIARIMATLGDYDAIADEHGEPIFLPRMDALAAWLKDLPALLALMALGLALLTVADHRLVFGRRSLERLRSALAGRLKAGPFVHRPAARLSFVDHGAIRLGPLDGGREGNPWDRLRLTLAVPDRTAVRLHVAVSDVADADLPDLGEPGFEAVWEHARANAPEWLVQNHRGRFLHLMVELDGTRDRTPVVERIVVYARRDTSLRYLPAVYQEDAAGRHVLDRLLALTDTVLAEVEGEIEEFWLHLDPRSAPAAALPWLASWFDLRFHASWDEATRRRVLTQVVEIWAWRGTARGLEQLLMLQEGGDATLPRAVEGIAAETDPRLQAWFGDLAGAREDAVLVVMPPGSLDRAEARQALLDLIAAYLPAQVRFALRAVTPGVRLDGAEQSGSVIGIDSLLGGPRPWVLPADDAQADGGPLDRLLPGTGAAQGLRVGSAEAGAGISSEGWRS